MICLEVFLFLTTSTLFCLLQRVKIFLEFPCQKNTSCPFFFFAMFLLKEFFCFVFEETNWILSTSYCFRRLELLSWKEKKTIIHLLLNEIYSSHSYCSTTFLLTFFSHNAYSMVHKVDILHIWVRYSCFFNPTNSCIFYSNYVFIHLIMIF